MITKDPTTNAHNGNNDSMMSEVDTVKELDYRFSHLRHMPKVGKLKKSGNRNFKKLKLKSTIDYATVQKEAQVTPVVPKLELPDVFNNRYQTVKSPMSKQSQPSKQGSKTSLDNYETRKS